MSTEPKSQTTELPVECWKCGAIGTAPCADRGCPLPNYPPLDQGVAASRDGHTYYRPLPEPFSWGLLPWLWRRITGWRDVYGRAAQRMTWRG